MHHTSRRYIDYIGTGVQNLSDFILKHYIRIKYTWTLENLVHFFLAMETTRQINLARGMQQLEQSNADEVDAKPFVHSNYVLNT